MSDHTPGPWHRADSTQVIGACGSHVADCAHAKDDGPTAGIACANARLIAAAPDMLRLLIDADDALRVVCCRIDIERKEAYESGKHAYVLGSQHASLVETWAEIRNAIAKVTT